MTLVFTLPGLTGALNLGISLYAVRYQANWSLALIGSLVSLPGVFGILLVINPIDAQERVELFTFALFLSTLNALLLPIQLYINTRWKLWRGISSRISWQTASIKLGVVAALYLVSPFIFGPQ